jgi:cyd operon protein YbgT
MWYFVWMLGLALACSVTAMCAIQREDNASK